MSVTFGRLRKFLVFSFLVPSINRNGLNYIIPAKGIYKYLALYYLKLAHAML